MVHSVGLAAIGFASGLEFLLTFDPAWRGCLVLDLLMPGMNGLNLQKRLNEMRVNLPIVFISGSADIPAAVQAIRAGAVDFLQKPYGQQHLLDAIHRALERGSA